MALVMDREMLSQLQMVNGWLHYISTVTLSKFTDNFSPETSFEVLIFCNYDFTENTWFKFRKV